MNVLVFVSILFVVVFVKVVMICLMIFDVDGVFIDGGLFYGEDGEVFKCFNVFDGYGIKMMQ